MLCCGNSVWSAILKDYVLLFFLKDYVLLFFLKDYVLLFFSCCFFLTIEC